jgi:hypothetical protein
MVKQYNFSIGRGCATVDPCAGIILFEDPAVLPWVLSSCQAKMITTTLTSPPRSGPGLIAMVVIMTFPRVLYGQFWNESALLQRTVASDSTPQYARLLA